MTPVGAGGYIVITFTSSGVEHTLEDGSTSSRVAVAQAGAAGDVGASGEQRSDDRWAERRALNNAFGDALAYAFEFAATPLLFAGLGWLLDRWLGTAPILAVVLGGFGFVGVCLRTGYRYVEKVKREEEGKPWTRRQR